MVEEVSRPKSKRNRTKTAKAKVKEIATAPARKGATKAADEDELAGSNDRPVIDVPIINTKAELIDAFIAKYSAWVKEFIEANFDGAEDRLVKAIVREMAECEIMERTPKDSTDWTADIIEEILTAFNAAHADALGALVPKTPKLKKPEAKAEPKAKAKAKKAAPKKAKPETAKEVQGELLTAEGEPAPKKPAPAKLKSLKGKAQFAAAVEQLRCSKKITLQAQDVDLVTDHLWSFHEKQAMPDAGIEGNGFKSYGKRRLCKTLSLVQALLAKVK